MERQVPMGVILADAGYGKGTQFRTALTQLGLQYIVGIESSATVWKPGQQPLPAPPQKPGRGVPSQLSINGMVRRLKTRPWMKVHCGEGEFYGRSCGWH
jgi:SRSO17 transposase